MKTNKNVEKIEFTLGVLSEGLSYEQASRFLCKIGLIPPSKNTFLRTQKAISSKIETLVENCLITIRNNLSNDITISYDGSWDHPRFSTRCFGAFIELEYGKIIYFFIVLRNKQPNQNFRVSTTDKFPQGLETEVLRKLAPYWFSDPRIRNFVQDTHNRNQSIFNDYNRTFFRKIAINHQFKKIINLVKRFISTNNFPKTIQRSIINFLKYIMFLDIADSRKQELWSNVINHYSGDHSHCIHSLNPNQDYIILTEPEIEKLHMFIILTLDELICTNKKNAYSIQ
ncbi:hypothetical protein TRFO_21774 [Tritrichomonas foetus]|uniref:Uncharacterized protein n=1 Tax=Tritrichomonas foetus TaxID=1144522 RepID=A0A1J4KE74_9EUKA|nr:hypothetical protein TRFO_21774 [Tritrichomonas foetus]|eukprot:OHT09306.1 hypothetical protein TRFO_21774 [Tritrichomonas foetus]